MTSISQPVVPNQLPSSASQQPSAPAHSRASSQAAGSGAAGNKTSYASATKKPFSPPPASSGSNQPPTSPAQHGKSGTTSPINGKMAIPPAVPTVGTSTVVNGNTLTSSSSGAGDLGRKPSVTISASGPPQYAQNGASVGVKGPAGSGIQFGSYNPDGSPRITNATLPHAQQSSSSLGVHNSSNPRITSPANSPSPIPQPPASGGKPPSHGQNLSVSFGNSGGPDQNVSVEQTSLIWKVRLISSTVAACYSFRPARKRSTTPSPRIITLTAQRHERSRHGPRRGQRRVRGSGWARAWLRWIGAILTADALLSATRLPSDSTEPAWEQSRHASIPTATTAEPSLRCLSKLSSPEHTQPRAAKCPTGAPATSPDVYAESADELWLRPSRSIWPIYQYGALPGIYSIFSSV